jgi:ABC-type nickel/cobalt efflux system permease component RcnA
VDMDQLLEVSCVCVCMCVCVCVCDAQVASLLPALRALVLLVRQCWRSFVSALRHASAVSAQPRTPCTAHFGARAHTHTHTHTTCVPDHAVTPYLPPPSGSTRHTRRSWAALPAAS